MTCHIKNNTITCYRGNSKNFLGEVKDRQDNKWFVDITKEQFDYRKEIMAFSEDGKIKKNFMKEYLIWIKCING